MALDFGWQSARRFWNGLWNPDKGRQSEGPGVSGSRSGAEVNDQRALQVSAVFSCIRLIAELCSSLPLVVYKRKPDGTRAPADDHWLAQLLREPNPFMTGQEFREALVASIASWGNGYAEKVSNSTGRVMELWPLKPVSVKVMRDGNDSLTYKYTRKGEGKPEIDLSQAEMLHVKGFGMDGVMGLSPLGMAREALGLSVAAEDYAGGFYANGGKPSGVLMIDKALNDQQRQQLEKKYSGMAHGGESAGNKLWILEAFARYQQITIPPEDAQMLGTRQFQLAEIARFFRVPLFLLMEMEKSTSWGTGLEQQNLAFLAYTLRPYLTRIEQSMNRWLLDDKERRQFYVEHNVEGLLRADSTARAAYMASLAQNGFLTRNEGRAYDNRAPMPGGDVLTVQSNLLPLDKLGLSPPAVTPSAAPEAPPPSGAS